MAILYGWHVVIDEKMWILVAEPVAHWFSDRLRVALIVRSGLEDDYEAHDFSIDFVFFLCSSCWVDELL